MSHSVKENFPSFAEKVMKKCYQYTEKLFVQKLFSGNLSDLQKKVNKISHNDSTVCIRNDYNKLYLPHNNNNFSNIKKYTENKAILKFFEHTF